MKDAKPRNYARSCERAKICASRVNTRLRRERDGYAALRDVFHYIYLSESTRYYRAGPSSRRKPLCPNLLGVPGGTAFVTRTLSICAESRKILLALSRYQRGADYTPVITFRLRTFGLLRTLRTSLSRQQPLR